MSRLSRNKGRDYQAAIAKRWRDSGLFPDAHSTQGSQARAVGACPVDIDGLAAFAVECKDGQHPRVWAALEQLEAACAKAGDTRTRIVVAHKKGDSQDHSVVAMRLVDFEALIRAQREGWEAA